MSWSLNLIGKPENLIAALEAHSASLGGMSKVKFDDAKPHLIGLVKQNVETRQGNAQPILKLEASGHGVNSQTPGEPDKTVYRNCWVSLTSYYHQLC